MGRPVGERRRLGTAAKRQLGRRHGSLCRENEMRGRSGRSSRRGGLSLPAPHGSSAAPPLLGFAPPQASPKPAAAPPLTFSSAALLNQVVLFGSFTEDETKLFQGQPAKSEEKSWELPEIQFGSQKFSVLSLEKVSNAITEGSAHSPKPTYGHTKDLAGSNKKETVTSCLPNGGPVLFNEARDRLIQQQKWQQVIKTSLGIFWPES